MEPEVQSTEVKEKHPVFKVTTLSKYLAMSLFILMPFVGGYIGYVYAPEKVVEVDKIVFESGDSDSPIELNIKKASSTLALESNHDGSR